MLVEKEKQEFFARGDDRYNSDVCCLQKKNLKIRLSNIVVSKYYGNGFITNNKWKDNIHRHRTNNHIIEIEK